MHIRSESERNGYKELIEDFLAEPEEYDYDGSPEREVELILDFLGQYTCPTYTFDCDFDVDEEEIKKTKNGYTAGISCLSIDDDFRVKIIDDQVELQFDKTKEKPYSLRRKKCSVEWTEPELQCPDEVIDFLLDTYLDDKIYEEYMNKSTHYS